MFVYLVFWLCGKRERARARIKLTQNIFNWRIQGARARVWWMNSTHARNTYNKHTSVGVKEAFSMHTYVRFRTHAHTPFLLMYLYAQWANCFGVPNRTNIRWLILLIIWWLFPNQTIKFLWCANIFPLRIANERNRYGKNINQNSDWIGKFSIKITSNRACCDSCFSILLWFSFIPLCKQQNYYISLPFRFFEQMFSDLPFDILLLALAHVIGKTKEKRETNENRLLS